MDNLKFIPLKDIKLDVWLQWNDSLTVERDTWSLDRNIWYYKTPGEAPKNETEYWDAFQTKEYMGAWGAFIDDKMIGFLSVIPWHHTDRKTFKQVFNIKDDFILQISLCINKEYWGQGLGTKFIKYVDVIGSKMYQKTNGYGAIVHRENPGSLRTFEKNGYNILSHWPPPKGDSFLVMKIIDRDNSKDQLLTFPGTIIDGTVYRSPMTFCLSVYNNLDYMKICIESVRRNSYFYDAPFVVYAENCTDGTNEWLSENKDKYNLDVYIEPNNKVRRGIGGGMNFCASKVKTPLLNFLQADLYACQNWDINLYRYLIHHNNKFPDIKYGVFSHRIQPDIFNELGTERAGTTFVPQEAFGAYHDDFDFEKLDKWVSEFVKLNKGSLVRKAEGVSGLFHKKDWDYIGGNDDRFAPAYWEDADLFIRMMNEGFDFVLTAESVLYHFASRSSRFPDDNLKVRPQHLADIEQNSLNEFVNKYGRLPDRDENDMVVPLPIIDGSPNCIEQEIK